MAKDKKSMISDMYRNYEKIKGTHVDHRIPSNIGGKDSKKNIYINKANMTPYYGRKMKAAKKGSKAMKKKKRSFLSKVLNSPGVKHFTRPFKDAAGVIKKGADKAHKYGYAAATGEYPKNKPNYSKMAKGAAKAVSLGALVGIAGKKKKK